MKLSQVDQAIAAGEKHLAEKSIAQTEVESFLTQYLLILVYASFEKEIKEIFQKRADRIDDPPIQSFLKYSIERLCRSIKINEISGLLGKFSDEYKDSFSNKIKDSEEVQQCYDNIVTNRNQLAHGSNCEITLNDLKNYYEKGHLVLDALSEVLEIR